MLEREAELGRTRAMLRAARDGAGELLLIEGDAGIGKTTLLQATVGCARAEGLRVLSARGGELERELAYGIARQLLERELAARDEPSRARLLDGAAAHAIPAILSAERLPGEAATAPDGFALQHGLYWLLSNLAEERPLVLVVDDLQWADAATMRFLIYLARRLEGMPIAVLATVRLPDGDTPTGPLATLRADARVGRLTLRPLGPSSVARIAQEALRCAPEPAFVQACHHVSAGNPFLVNELLFALRDAGIAPDDGNASRVERVGPSAIARSVALRLAPLSPAAIALAQAAAVLGGGAHLRHAGRMAGLAAAELHAALDVLVEARLLAPDATLEFQHPLVRSAIYQDLPLGRRARDHRVAAEQLAAEGVDPERVAGHLLQTVAGADGWVVAQLRAAAAVARGRGAPDVAAEYLRRALAEPPPAGERGPLLHDLGRARFLCGDYDGLDDMREALALIDDPRERAPVVSEVAATLALTDGAAEAVGMLDDAIGGLQPDDPLVLELRGVLVHTAQFDVRLSATVEQRLRPQDEELAGSTPDERLVLATLAYRHTLHGSSPERAVQLARRAIAGGRLFEDLSTDMLRPMYAVYALMHAERFDEADAAIERFAATAARAGSLMAFAGAGCLRRDLAYRQGALGVAVENARAALESERTLGAMDLVTLATLLETLVARGDVEEAGRELAAASIDERWLAGPGVFQLFVLNGRAALRAAQGDVEGGLEDLLELGRRCEQWGANPVQFNWRSRAAELLLACGEPERARELARTDVTHARRWGTPRLLAIALRAQGVADGGDAGIELLQEARTTIDGSPALLTHAEVLVDLGAALRRSGQRAAAREPLRRGHELATRCEAAPLVRRAAVELEASGARARSVVRSGVDALTPSERRVCELAAQGMSNPQIAQTLFVTRSTIESQLHAAYRKLDVAGRGDLARVLGRARELP